MSLKHLINDEIFFLFLNLDKVLRNSTPGEFVYIWQSKRDGTIAMTIEKREFIFKRLFTCRRRPRILRSLLKHLFTTVTLFGFFGISTDKYLIS